MIFEYKLQKSGLKIADTNILDQIWGTVIWELKRRKVKDIIKMDEKIDEEKNDNTTRNLGGFPRLITRHWNAETYINQLFDKISHSIYQTSVSKKCTFTSKELHDLFIDENTSRSEKNIELFVKYALQKINKESFEKYEKYLEKNREYIKFDFTKINKDNIIYREIFFEQLKNTLHTGADFKEVKSNPPTLHFYEDEEQTEIVKTILFEDVLTPRKVKRIAYSLSKNIQESKVEKLNKDNELNEDVINKIKEVCSYYV